MNRGFGLFLLTLSAAAVPAVTAQAQYYPASPPYYRAAPSDAYDNRLPAPSFWAEDDDDVPVVRRPSPAPRYSQMPAQDQHGPSGAPNRILPYPDEGDSVIPPAPGFARPYGRPPVYGHQLEAQSPQAPPAARYETEVIRPPAEIGVAPNTAPQQGAPQQTVPSTSVMTLPPEDQPEVGQPKELPANLKKQLVDYNTAEPAGTLIVDTPNTYLYLVLGGGKAIRYGIGVGREGFTWAGAERVSKMKEWPDWFPPTEMIERQPYLPRMMAGGPGNPLGARALYLGKTLYRIHGTNQPSTIGSFVSSGCIRLLNEDIEDLYSRVQVGTRVVVLPGKQPETVANSTIAVPPAVSNSAPNAGRAPASGHLPPAITSGQLPPLR
ncbi:MAG: L,D-transpeptidase family protein [Rhizobiales bacterium]|nr:L,D-transpeptidase family protein [Hyphomicrobiales bacterium]